MRVYWGMLEGMVMRVYMQEGGDGSCIYAARVRHSHWPYKASGEMSPRVFMSAALYALYNDCVSSPYSDCGPSMVSYERDGQHTVCRARRKPLRRSNDVPGCGELSKQSRCKSLDMRNPNLTYSSVSSVACRSHRSARCGTQPVQTWVWTEYMSRIAQEGYTHQPV